MNKQQPEALPRYSAYTHLRSTGVWPDGVPEWAKDYSGQMNDMTAANAVIEELHSKVEALSAAPAIAKLRHLYQNMVNGAVRDTASAKRIAEGLLAPAIEALERATPPAEQQAAQVIIDFSQVGTAGPFPVANGRVSLPDATMQDLARMLRPTYEAEQQAAPKAAPGVGNSGFDHQTAADFLSGKTVSDEAVRKFVAASRWAHDERAALSATLLAMHGVLTSREAEIALLKKALLEAETAPQPAPDCHHRPPCDECAALAAQGGK